MRHNIYGDLNSQIGTHCPIPIISTNGYYGFQPVRNQPHNKPEECHNQMEVDAICFSQNENMIQNNTDIHLFNRKRPNSEPIDVQTIKKRRQNGNFQAAEALKPKFGRKPTHNLPDIPRSVFTHF